MKINSLLAGVALMATSYTVCAQDNTVTVQTKKIGADIQPTMYGVFFEDINFGADGGLYAELVKNRSFEFAPTITWVGRCLATLRCRTTVPSIRIRITSV